MKKTILLLFAFSWLISVSLTSNAQVVRSGLIKLLPEKLSLSPDEFYIRAVSDERPVKTSIGSLFLKENGKLHEHPIDLDGGTFETVRKFLLQGINHDTLLRPVNIRIKECSIKESISGENRISGEVNMIFYFDLYKEDGSVPLTQYSSTAKYTRSVNNISGMEPTIRKMLGNSLKFINNWMNTEAPRNPKLVRGLKVLFKDYTEQHDDTVYYQPSRPLVWDDFRDKISHSRFSATVFPSFGYDQKTEIINGIITVEISLKVFVIKSASWVGAGMKSNYHLNHEQRHFDLVKLIAQRFKQKIMSESLKPDNYEGIINFEYLEFYRKMNDVQLEYDTQTAHGTIPAIQEFWNRKIDRELKEES